MDLVGTSSSMTTLKDEVKCMIFLVVQSLSTIKNGSMTTTKAEVEGMVFLVTEEEAIKEDATL